MPLTDWTVSHRAGVGTDEQVSVLLAREPAAHAALDDPSAVIELLGALRGVGAEEQVAVLAGRLAAHASFDNPSAPVLLLEILRRVGTEEQFGAFVHRLIAEGRFDLFRQEADYHARYRFGRESDGSPAPVWGWQDLD